MKNGIYKNGGGSGIITTYKPVTWSQDAISATTWTTDEKILLAKFNIIGIYLPDMLKKYFGTSTVLKISHYKGDLGEVYSKGLNYGDINDMIITPDGKKYFANLDNLKKYILPSLNTNVTDALTKILIGEGVIAKVIDIVQPVVTTPVTPVVTAKVIDIVQPVVTTPVTPVVTTTTPKNNTIPSPPPNVIETTTPTAEAAKDYKLYYIGAGILVVAIVGVVIILKK